MLPHQYELLADTKSSIIAMVCGFGSGKTYAIARKAILLSIASPGCDGIITEPNYPLITQILYPELNKALDEMGIPYSLNKSDGIYEFYVPGSRTPNRLICKSAESYERLIGISAAFVIMDEFDTTKADLAYSAYMKLLGRIRVGNQRQMVIVSTPEGFGAMYRIFVKENQGTQGIGKRVIHAKSTDNYHLPSSYLDNMRNQYSKELISAYINGEFVNLTQGTVYDYFKRDQCVEHTLNEDEIIHVGQDFNAGGCASVLFTKRGNNLVAFDTVTSKDTFSIVNEIKKKYPNDLVFYPDAAGNQHKSNATQTDLEILKSQGYQCLGKKVNPRIQDRVNSVNSALQTQKLQVAKGNDTLIEALEQQAYEKDQPQKFSGPATIDDFNDAMGYCVYYIHPLVRNRTYITGQ